jgi:hypothetical protein
VVRSSAVTEPSRVAYVFERLRIVIASAVTAMRAWSVHQARVTAGGGDGAPAQLG